MTIFRGTSTEDKISSFCFSFVSEQVTNDHISGLSNGGERREKCSIKANHHGPTRPLVPFIFDSPYSFPSIQPATSSHNCISHCVGDFGTALEQPATTADEQTGLGHLSLPASTSIDELPIFSLLQLSFFDDIVCGLLFRPLPRSCC